MLISRWDLDTVSVLFSRHQTREMGDTHARY